MRVTVVAISLVSWDGCPETEGDRACWGSGGHFLRCRLPAMIPAPDTPCVDSEHPAPELPNLRGPRPRQRLWSLEAFSPVVPSCSAIPRHPSGSVHRPLVAGFFFAQVLRKHRRYPSRCLHLLWRDRQEGIMQGAQRGTSHTAVPPPADYLPPSGLTFTRQTLSSPSFHTPPAALADPRWSLS